MVVPELAMIVSSGTRNQNLESKWAMAASFGQAKTKCTNDSLSRNRQIQQSFRLSDTVYYIYHHFISLSLRYIHIIMTLCNSI